MRRLREAAHNFLRFFEHDKRRVGLFALVLLIVGGGIFAGHSAHALISDAIAEGINWIFQVLTLAFGQIFVWASSMLVWIMGYNDFINSIAVRTGWIVVRDFTNMMFILVLLVIAFGIMFGRHEYGDVSMLPTLIAIALIINFSRTLIGFMIDISQVFTLTFVNAFVAAGAGNFAEIFSVSEAVQANPNFGSVEAVKNFTMSSFFGLAMVLIATIIMVVLLVVMAYRIVALWLLTVLAPLAWFMRIVPTAHEYYAEWWKEFKKNLLMGPVMAFFLWLTLATAAAASDEINLARPNGSINPNQQLAGTEGATYGRLMMGIIAIAMLMKGLEIAAGMGGVGAGLLKKAEGAARGAVGFAGGAVAGAYGFVGGKAVRGAAGLAGMGAAPESRRGRFTGAIATAPDLRALALGKTAQGVQAIGGAATRVGAAQLGGKITAGATAISGLEAKMTESQKAAAKAGVVDVSKPGANVGLANQQMMQLAKIPTAALTKDQKDQLKFMSTNALDNPEQVGKLKEADMPAFKKAYEGLYNEPGKVDKAKMHHFEEFQAKNLDKWAPGERAGVMAGIHDTKIQSQVSSDALRGKQADGSFDANAGAAVAAAMSNEAVVSVMRSGDLTKEAAAFKGVTPDRVKALASSGKLQASDVDATHISSMSSENVVAMMGGFNATKQAEMRDGGDRQAAMREQFKARDKAEEKLVGGEAARAELATIDAIAPADFTPANLTRKKELEANIGNQTRHDDKTRAVKLEMFAARNAGTPDPSVTPETTLGVTDAGGFTDDIARNDMAAMAKNADQVTVLLSNMPENVLRDKNSPAMKVIMENAGPQFWGDLARNNDRKPFTAERTAALQELAKNAAEGAFGAKVQTEHGKKFKTTLVENFVKV